MKNIMRFLSIAAVVFSTAFMVTGCSKSDEEKVVEAVEKAADDAIDTADKAASDLKQKLGD